MITDPKDQKEFFAVPETVTNADEFKSWFQETFVRKDKAAEDKAVRIKVSGEVLGAEMTNIKRHLKEQGIEFTEDEMKELMALPSHKNEAMISAGLKKMQGGYVNQIEELKKSAGQGNDEKIKALEDALAKKDGKIKEVEAAWKTTATALEETKKQGEATLRSFKISTKLSEAEKGVKFKQKLTEVEKMGYEAAKKERLKFDLNESGDDVEPFNAKGERIPSKNKAGSFVTLTEALQDLANELGLAEINPHGGKQTASPFQSKSTGHDQGESGKTILVRGKPVKV